MYTDNRDLLLKYFEAKSKINLQYSSGRS